MILTILGFDYDGGRGGWAARRFPADDSTQADDSAQTDDSAAADAETGMPVRESRTLPVPDGVAGMRVDAGVARILGISRTTAAELAAASDITVDGIAAGKSDKLPVGAMLDVLLPAPAQPLQVETHPVEDLAVVYHDSDIIVVDKPVGVAAHPSQGWSSPTVVGALEAAGFRVSTSGPPSVRASCNASTWARPG